MQLNFVEQPPPAPPPPRGVCHRTPSLARRRSALSPAPSLPPPQVRTQTLVKGCIVQVDAAPFKQWYQQHYGVEVGQKKRSAAAAAAPAESEAAAQSNHVKRKLKQRNQGRKLDQLLDDQFATGRLYAALSSRPGQVRWARRGCSLPRLWRGCRTRRVGVRAAARGRTAGCSAAGTAGAGVTLIAGAPSLLCSPAHPQQLLLSRALKIISFLAYCSAAALMATFWRAASLSSTSAKWPRRRCGASCFWVARPQVCLLLPGSFRLSSSLRSTLVCSLPCACRASLPPE